MQRLRKLKTVPDPLKKWCVTSNNPKIKLEKKVLHFFDVSFLYIFIYWKVIKRNKTNNIGVIKWEGMTREEGVTDSHLKNVRDKSEKPSMQTFFWRNIETFVFFLQKILFCYEIFQISYNQKFCFDKKNSCVWDIFESADVVAKKNKF